MKYIPIYKTTQWKVGFIENDRLSIERNMEEILERILTMSLKRLNEIQDKSFIPLQWPKVNEKWKLKSLRKPAGTAQSMFLVDHLICAIINS